MSLLTSGVRVDALAGAGEVSTDEVIGVAVALEFTLPAPADEVDEVEMADASALNVLVLVESDANSGLAPPTLAAGAAEGGGLMPLGLLALPVGVLGSS